MRIHFFLIIVIFLVLSLSIVVCIQLCWRKVRIGQALVIRRMNGEQRVSFCGEIVLPLVNRDALIDMTSQIIQIIPKPTEILTSQDNQLMQYRAVFYLRIKHNREDLMKVIQQIGIGEASDPDGLDRYFRPRFIRAMQHVASRMSCEKMYKDPKYFQEQVLLFLGSELDGCSLDAAVITDLERLAPDPIGPFR